MVPTDAVTNEVQYHALCQWLLDLEGQNNEESFCSVSSILEFKNLYNYVKSSAFKSGYFQSSRHCQ